MTTDNVTPFVGPAGPAGPPTPPPPDTLETYFGRDAWKLRLCAQWRAERAQQEKNWAEHDVVHGWGYLKDDLHDLNTDPLQRMLDLEHHLARLEPCTVLLARELLSVCITILARQKEDPEHTMADGPILEIVRNVVEALGSLAGDTRIGPKPAESTAVDRMQEE